MVQPLGRGLGHSVGENEGVSLSQSSSVALKHNVPSLFSKLILRVFILCQ